MKAKWPSVSFIVCTYNCRDYAVRCFESIKKQEYGGKVELLAIDGSSKGQSNDGTIEALKEMGVKIVPTNARPEGKMAAKWVGYTKAKGEILIFVDSDNALVEDDWVRQMVKPLMEERANFSICRMLVSKEDILANQYLSLIGTDPFADYKSIDSQLGMKRLKLEDKGEFYTYTMKQENFLIAGGYYFTIKKKTLDKIGGYTQDTDVVYNLIKNGRGIVAIPKNAHIHHLITRGVLDFTKKKYRWGKIYFQEQIHNRDFNWMPQSRTEKLKLYARVARNLLFVPNFIQGVYLAIRDRERAWLMHGMMSWLTTAAYLKAYFDSKKT
ncbi:MAG: glycosyltransferase family 2 protein [Nanoarchaeota archaeon]